MSKRFIAAAALVLLALSVFAAGGCGSNTAQAKKDMQAADKAYSAVKSQMDQLQATLTPMLAGATAGNFSTLTPAALKTASDDMSRIIAELPGVKAEYQKITSLTGVDDYVAYAKAMIVTVDADQAALTAGKKMIDDITPLVDAGNTAAVTQYFVNNAEALNKANDLGNAASKAYDAAQAIKTAKNL
jgi:hypothetical protein